MIFFEFRHFFVGIFSTSTAGTVTRAIKQYNKDNDATFNR